MLNVINRNIPASHIPKKGIKRKRKGFNACRIMTSLYPPYEDEDDSDSAMESCDEPEYEYYDASGTPYYDTVIRPKSLMDDILKKQAIEVAEKEKKELEEIMNCDCDMFTSLHNPEEVCPKRLLDEFDDWSTALEAYHNEKEMEIERERRAEFDEADRRNSELCKKLELELIMSKLPRFSTAMLARMKAEEEAKNKEEPRASEQFYSKSKQTKQDSNVFGHRRNGGGKKGMKAKNQVMVAKIGTISLDSIRNKKYKKLMIEREQEARLSRNIRRANAKLKAAEEEEKRSKIREEVMERVKLAKVNVPKPVENVVEETEYQKFKRQELNDIVEKQKKMFETIPDPVVDYKIDKVVQEKAPVKIVEKTATERVQDELTAMLYGDIKTRDVKCTRMCRSFTSGGKCPHGDKCAFAHNLDEYNPVNCAFGYKCRNTKCDRTTGLWTNNTGTRICMFIHPAEDKAKYCERIGVVQSTKQTSNNIRQKRYTTDVKQQDNNRKENDRKQQYNNRKENNKQQGNNRKENDKKQSPSNRWNVLA